MLVKDIREFRSMPVRGLDRQVVWKFNQMNPGVLVSLEGLPISHGDGLLPYLQKPARDALERYLKIYKASITVNNAYRSIIVQTVFWNNRSLAPGMVAQPGKSDHGNGAAIDINEWSSQKNNLISSGWKWSYGSRDAMHFDWTEGIEYIKDDTVKAFQALWNEANPKNAIAVDGGLGPRTMECINNSPAEGFGDVGYPRTLRLTSPMQSGNDVKALQQALKVENPDGFFGEATEALVKGYQSANSLSPDGIISAVGETRVMLGLNS